MRTLSKGILITLGLTAGTAAGLRLASRFHPSPCPANLSWLLENPYVNAVAGAETILGRLDLTPGMRALDVGCGTGRLAVPAAQQVAPEGEVVALDIQEEMLSRTRRRAAQAGLSNLRTLHAGAGQGAMPERYFDRAWLVTVLGELPDKEAALAEIYAALKPGGLFSVTEMLPDPDYQSRTTVRRLAVQAGFIEKADFGNWLAFTINFVKPAGSAKQTGYRPHNSAERVSHRQRKLSKLTSIRYHLPASRKQSIILCLGRSGTMQLRPLSILLCLTSLLLACDTLLDSSSAGDDENPPTEQISAVEESGNSGPHPADNESLARDFPLPIPLFAPDSAWNQQASEAAVLLESDQQILVTFRVLLGDHRTLEGYDGPGTTWPYMDINLDEYAVPIYRAGQHEQQVFICEDEGVLGWPHPKFGLAGEQAGEPVTVPAPSGPVRAAGPQNDDADGHLVLFQPNTMIAYDFFAANVREGDDCQGFRGGVLGERVYQAGVVDYFDIKGPGANADGLYSARAHGTPLLAGLILPEDIESGTIAHALAFAIPGPRNLSPDPYLPLTSDYYYPASTTETDFFNTNPFALAAGQRIRLKQTVVDEDGQPIDESALAPITHLFLAALRNYGAYLVDNAGGFSFYAEDPHTAVLHLSDDQVNSLIGQPEGTALPSGMTKWQIILAKLGQDLERIPFAITPGDEEPDPETAMIEAANFEVIEPAFKP